MKKVFRIMKMKGIVLILLVLLVSCGRPTYYEYGDELKKQRVLNSSKILYSYSNAGKFVSSNFNKGVFVLNSTENVYEARNIRDLLPFYYTKFDFESNIIEAIELIDLKDSIKVKNKGIYEIRHNRITYKVKRYYTRSASLGLFFSYHNMRETNDSIFFDKLILLYTIEPPDVIEKIGFRKGNIIVEEDSNGFIIKIIVNYLNQDLHGLTFEDQIYLPPLSTVYSRSIHLSPDPLIKYQNISDYGVFKYVK